jgi:MFS family permease
LFYFDDQSFKAKKCLDPRCGNPFGPQTLSKKGACPMFDALPVAAISDRRLTVRDYKTLSLATLGGLLEFYDFIIFVFFANTIGQLFFPPEIPDWLRQFQTFGIFAAGYLARPLGGVLMAHAGDLRGRKQMFTLSIFLMALPTLGIGLLPNYAKLGFWAPVLLLLLRILQGVAVGGEVPGAWVFVSEHVDPSHVGIACGILTAGLTGGILLGSLVAAALSMGMTHDQLAAYGWRIPFLLGGAFGLLSMYLRRLLAETPVFLELKARQALASETPLKTVLRDYRGAVVLSGLLTWMLSAAIVVVILMTPALLEKMYGVEAGVALRANSLAALALTAGCVLAGYLTDRFGPGPILMAGCPLLAVAAYLTYIAGPSDPWLTMILYTVAGLTVGVVAVVPYVMIALFPPEIRFSGISFSYNLAYAVFGGLTPIVVAWLLRFDRLAPAHYVGVLCLLGLGIGVFLAAPGSTHKIVKDGKSRGGLRLS